ncbi:hypothetical protein [Curtobacterium sp. MCBA15_004]|uniref:hypothetical protein n=1 Tax=Curtobacterium sp. MCBA15_004 TaxID=1898733 RepID=UPI000A3ECC63|nr:hypothetical protein [Curtobacterium sp. MCBA15_004]WIA98026.1 hypothetical protein QOL16_06465 [Curtobacterium sp. MCBA15_004]
MAILTAQTFILTVSGTRLDAVDDQVRVVMDEGNSPWLTATAIIQRPADATMALLDPDRAGTVVLRLVAPATLTLTLRVQGRTYDPEQDLVGLTLVSDEFPLLTYAPSAPVDLRGGTYQGSVRALASAVVTTALGRPVTVALGPGATNRAFPTYAAAENAFPDPSVTSANNWTADSSPTGQWAKSQTTDGGFNSVQVLRAGSGTVNWVQVANATPISASAGQQYTGTVLPIARGNGAVTGILHMQFLDSNGIPVAAPSQPLGVLPTTWSSAVRRGITATAPLGTASVRLWLNGSGTGTLWGVAGAQWMLVEGDGRETDGASWTTFFTGDTPAGTNGYTYSWAGAVNASTSKRTPIVERDPSTLLWSTTDTADAFLRPVLEATGLRLFQDETGTFLLADNSYRVPGQVVMQRGSTLYQASESSSILDRDVDGYPLNADAVILTYRWTDAAGVARTAVDTASTTASYSRPYVLDKSAPYPGPGQAQFLLARLRARRRQIATEGRPDWTARPGMSALVSLPNRPAASGYVQALEWDLGRATMTVTTKNLVTTPPGSIGNAPLTQTIGAVSGTIAAYTN